MTDEELKTTMAEIAAVKAGLGAIFGPLMSAVDKVDDRAAAHLAATEKIADALSRLADAQSRIATVFEGEMNDNQTTLERIALALETIPTRMGDMVDHGFGKKIV